MSYYTGDLNKLLKNTYILFKHLGFEASMEEDGDFIRFTCDSFKNEGSKGNGPWVYDIRHYEYNSSLDKLMSCVLMERLDNETKKYHKSTIWGGEYTGNSKAWYSYSESEWINMVLYCMVPSSKISPLYQEWGLSKDFDKSDFDPIARHLKLQLLDI